jgi:hypothetical protein
MAKFECPSCGYLLVDASSCSECGKSVEQSAKEWRERSDGLRWTTFALTGGAVLMVSAPLWLNILNALIAGSEPRGFAWVIAIFILAHMAAVMWPAWRVMVAGRDRLPLSRVIAAIPLSALAIAILWFILLRSAPRSGSLPLAFSPVPSMMLSALLVIILPLPAGWLASWLLRRMTKRPSWYAAFAQPSVPGTFTPAFPASASAEQPKPGEAGDSA